MPLISQPLAGPTGLGAGAAFGCTSAALIAVGAAAVTAGPAGAVSAGSATALVIIYFGTGLVFEFIAMRRGTPSGMSLALGSYLVRVLALGGVGLWLVSSPPLIGQLDRTWVGIGVLAAVLGWLTGLVVTHSRMRIPVYDQVGQR